MSQYRNPKTVRHEQNSQKVDLIGVDLTKLYFAKNRHNIGTYKQKITFVTLLKELEFLNGSLIHCIYKRNVIISF